MPDSLTAKESAEEIALGREATTILEAPLFRAAMAAMRLSEKKRWWESSPNDPSAVAVREEAFRMLRIIDDFEKTLTKLVTSGNLAEMQAAAEELEADEQQRFTSSNERRARL